MDTMPPHLFLGVQNVRLRRELHYGEHDPCLAPQPFDLSTAHLTVIRFPGSAPSTATPGDGYTTILWARPSETDFEPIAGQTLSENPVGLMSSNLIEQLEKEVEDIYRRLSSPRNPAADPKVKEYRARIRYLLARLRSPSVSSEANMIWSIAQRVALELDARITWTVHVEPFWEKATAWKVPATREVVGTLTDRLEVAESCYRVSRSFSAKLGRHVNRFLGWNSCLGAARAFRSGFDRKGSALA